MSEREPKNKLVEESSIQIIENSTKKEVPVASNQNLQNRRDEWRVVEPTDANKWSITASQEDFKRLYESLTKNKEKQMKVKEDISFKSKPTKKKQGEKKEVEKGLKKEELNRLRILKLQEPIVQNFKATHIHTMGGSELSSLRSELKLTTFKFLLYAIHELKSADPNQLEESEIVISQLKEPYVIARNLTIQIDIKLFKAINDGNDKKVSKKYQSFVKCFMRNISQESNHLLRRKLLTRKISPGELSSLSEQDLYPPEIQRKLIERKNYLLRESTVIPKQSNINEQSSIAGEQSQNYIKRPSSPKRQTVPSKQHSKKRNRYEDEKQKLQILQRLLSSEQIKVLKRNVELIEQPQIHKKLSEHIDFIFGQHSKSK